jgi:hypothetical protein
MLSPSCGGDLITLDERPKASRMWGVNSGFLRFPARQFHRVMKLWHAELTGPDAIRDRPVKHFDQPFLNRLVLRERISFEPYPNLWIDMPPMYVGFRGDFALHASTKLLHFCWPHKESCRDHMSAVLESLRRGDSRKAIERTILELNAPAMDRIRNGGRA